ncbi:MAG TPA: hypothetical protein VN329_11520 [Roseomonas sp.]|nr:hypothetical protein [Roseomonas sp.]
MHVWTIVVVALSPNAAPATPPALVQRYFATALACERSAAAVSLPAGMRLVCLPADGDREVALAAAY